MRRYLKFTSVLDGGRDVYNNLEMNNGKIPRYQFQFSTQTLIIFTVDFPTRLSKLDWGCFPFFSRFQRRRHCSSLLCSADLIYFFNWSILRYCHHLRFLYLAFNYLLILFELHGMFFFCFSQFDIISIVKS